VFSGKERTCDRARAEPTEPLTGGRDVVRRPRDDPEVERRDVMPVILVGGNWPVNHPPPPIEIETIVGLASDAPKGRCWLSKAEPSIVIRSGPARGLSSLTVENGANTPWASGNFA
jgi:hypothetical protein